MTILPGHDQMASPQLLGLRWPQSKCWRRPCDAERTRDRAHDLGLNFPRFPVLRLFRPPRLARSPRTPRALLTELRSPLPAYVSLGPAPRICRDACGARGGRSVPVGAFLPTDSVAALVTPGPHVWRKFHPYLQPLFTLRPSQITWVNGTSRKRSGWFTVAIRAQGTRQSLALPATQNVAGGPTVCSPPGLAQPGPRAAQTTGVSAARHPLP